VLSQQLERAAASQHRVKVPIIRGSMRPGNGRHFHFTPETFFQISGRDDFDLPYQQFSLLADDICVMPVGIPHKELVSARQGPFRQIVFMFTSTTVAWHLKEGATNERAPQFVHPTRIMTSPNAARAIDRLSEVAIAAHEQSSTSAYLIQGALLTYVSLLKMLLDEGNHGIRVESHRVTLCRHEVMRHLSEPSLSVRDLARKLDCSPNYLSHQFHAETGIPLVQHIERERMLQAKSMLDSTTLSVKELSTLVGHPDASYFARVFRRLEGLTPRQYRNRRRT
jgi:AraC-like DNA-binding protein